MEEANNNEIRVRRYKDLKPNSDERLQFVSFGIAAVINAAIRSGIAPPWAAINSRPTSTSASYQFERWLHNHWYQLESGLPKSTRWLNDLARLYDMWNQSGDAYHSVDLEIRRKTRVKDKYGENDREELSGLTEQHSYIDGSALHRMWRDAGCPYPNREIDKYLKALQDCREAKGHEYRARWLAAETAAKLTRELQLRPDKPERIYVRQFAARNRAKVARLRAQEAKKKAPKRRRGRPITKYKHDLWFDGFLLRTGQDPNPMLTLFKVAAHGTCNPVRAKEAVAEALWLAVRKLRRDSKKLRFKSQEQFNTWLRAFVRTTVKRYRNDSWGDIIRRRKENIVIARGLPEWFNRPFAKAKRVADMDGQEERFVGKEWQTGNNDNYLFLEPLPKEIFHALSH